MAFKNPKKHHRGTFNPYPSGVFKRYESKVIGLALVVYCLLEHLVKKAGIDESVRDLFLDFEHIALTKAKLPDGTKVSHVENALPFHYRTLEKLGLLVGEYQRPST
ncbi:MAG: hypothetical protein ACOZCF_12055 [Bacillota bacterium]